MMSLNALGQLMDIDDELGVVAGGLIESAKDCLGKDAAQRSLDLCGALLRHSEALFAAMENLRGLIHDYLCCEPPKRIGLAKTFSTVPPSLPGWVRSNNKNKQTNASAQHVSKKRK
jgi:hypothetical protein